MNSLRRALRLFAAPADSTALILRSYSSSSTTRRRSKSIPPPPTDTDEIPRPKEIPFQPKVANAVNLIGQVRMPVQFQTFPDGRTYAATVITRQESHSSPFLWIPVIFEGDLAHSAACHLKEDDFIYVAGQLTADPPRLGENQIQSNSNIQVVVQSLNFVQGYPQLEKISATSKQECTASEEHVIDNTWNDLLSNPFEWWDVRYLKENPKGAAFERKTDGELLFINSSTPKWLQDKLDSMSIDLKPELKHSTNDLKKVRDSSLAPWTDLLDDPKQWTDYRDSKRDGQVNPRFPDFKRKDGNGALWLNNAPKWVLSRLEELKFDVPAVKSKQAKDFKGDEPWNDLVNNPTKWWDNRIDKRNPKAPDFKHKETGEVLWLNDSPSWVLSKLPPMKPKESAEFGRKKLVS
ncbi:hypothetical protein HN873_052952 [Arachis hypogaea]|uniref:Protein OSB2 n=1 Tax=Arachis hypogaea TaxID=3818 RepID=A0A444YZ95_ARAHY|nr:Protein OSB3/mitochondrial [Arachis hypogaea]QHO13666.1 Protein OSB3/mitochondrial [Arachis hypogaea]RYR07277.1 hypothetical protein Ahy_B05g074597 isoform A [Arachis hypogaea]RYR07278.1 hypothetical protein Ahy_B05g074597 isoform B [Arachis hypogaea]